MNYSLRLSIPLLSSLALGLCSTNLLAVDMTTEILAQKGLITLEEYEKIRKTQSTQAIVDTTEGLKFSTADKKFSAQIGTMLQLDAAGYDSDIKDSTGRDLTNAGSEFRRVRLYMNGTFSSVWDYKTEIDFATTAQLIDGYVTYRGFQTKTPLQFTMGHFKIPFSQESLMADKSMTFMERSLPNVFLNARAPGVMLSAGKDNWSSALMLFGEQISSTASSVSDEAGGASLRLTWAPWIAPGANLHFGIASSIRFPSQNNTSLTTTPISYTEAVRFRAKPESNISELRLVDTGNIIDLDQTQLMGIELAGSIGAAGFNAEFINTKIQRKNQREDLEFSGWYAQTSWTITGEQRGYKGDKGLYDGIKPASSSGAWELALRLSEIDLNDGPLQLRNSLWLPEINGGKERNATLALNWYLNAFIRGSLNYVSVLDIEGGNYQDKNLDALQMRWQLAF
jgi:phosphate-selective porin OprO and OprP